MGVVPSGEAGAHVKDGDVDLATLTTGHLVTCNVDERAKKVAELFDKYNLRSLAGVDDEKKMAGVILAEHVIAQLRER
jgi:magnesium transporter